MCWFLQCHCLFPDTRDENLQAIGQLIEIVVSPELRRYDAMRWGEDPLETLGRSLRGLDSAHPYEFNFENECRMLGYARYVGSPIAYF